MTHRIVMAGPSTSLMKANKQDVHARDKRVLDGGDSVP